MLPVFAVGAAVIVLTLGYLLTNRRVTRGLAVGDSILAHGGAVAVLHRGSGAVWDNVARVSAGSPAVLRQAQDAFSRMRYSHVVVLAGVNDGDSPAERTMNNLSQIITLAKRQGARVIVVTETPFREYVSWTQAAQNRQDAVRAWLLSGRSGASAVVDAFALISRVGEDALAPDGLHLNQYGQELLGTAILRAL